MRESVSSSSSSRSGSSSITSTLGCPRSRVLRLILPSPLCLGGLLFRRAQRALHRETEVRPGTARQQLERCAVGIRQLPRDVESEPRAPRPGGEKRLEDLPAQLGGDARTVVAQLAYYGITHVARPTEYLDASLVLLAML